MILVKIKGVFPKNTPVCDLLKYKRDVESTPLRKVFSTLIHLTNILPQMRFLSSFFPELLFICLSFAKTIVQLHIVPERRVPPLIRLGTRNRETVRHHARRIAHPLDIKHREDIPLLLAKRR